MVNQQPRRTGAVIIPLKGFSKAKERLATVFDADTRSLLAKLTAEGVIGAAMRLPDVTRVLVVTDDESCAGWARAKGTEALIETTGLNSSVAMAYHHIGNSVDWVMICHADIVHPERLAAVPSPGSAKAILVRDRHRDGTNVMVLPADQDFEFHYGSGSAEAHRAECAKRGLKLIEVIDDLLGIDVDTPADLAMLPEPLKQRLGFTSL
jgi:2-phospho-L-lactate guanylyltransferase